MAVRRIWPRDCGRGPDGITIHVYSVCWNEREMLPYYLRHYESIADKFIILDDGSTDGSVELLRGHPNVEVRVLERDPTSFVLSAQRLYNDVWKHSRGSADWVVVCDIDEHLYHPNLRDYLARRTTRGVTVVPSRGYEMVSWSFPASDVRLFDTIPNGAPADYMEKLSIFNPHAVDEINYAPGRHDATPWGRVVYPRRTEVSLLHYKYLGLEYLTRRYAELRTRRGPVDNARGWGGHYYLKPEELVRAFVDVASNAVKVV